MILIWFHCAVIGLIFFLRFQRHFSFLIYFWSCWVFISAHRLSLVEVSRDLSWLQHRAHCGGFSCCGAQALGTWASVVAAHGLSSYDTWLRCSTACGIFLHQGSNSYPLHWQVDSYPLHHQGSPGFAFGLVLLCLNIEFSNTKCLWFFCGIPYSE